MPNSRFSDCWSSMGEVTFFHRNGVCFWKKRAHPKFPGTPAQLEHQAIHLRALEAWRKLAPEVQERWNELAVSVISHKPPFRKDHHISGHNLFVSAYHGFAQLGDEHIPEPQVYEEFPAFVCEYDSSTIENGTNLRIRLRVKMEGKVIPSKYRIAVRIQLTRAGAGRQPGYLRSFIASGNCTSEDCIVEIVIPDFKDIWKLDLDSYQVHLRYFLIDSKTGYRNIFKRKSFLMSVFE